MIGLTILRQTFGIEVSHPFLAPNGATYFCPERNPSISRRWDPRGQLHEARAALGLELPQNPRPAELPATDLERLEENCHARVGWDGMGWDGMGWDGMGWDGLQASEDFREFGIGLLF